MANHLDKFLDQVQRQGLAVSLVVVASISGYYIMTSHNHEQLGMFKAHIVDIKTENTLLYNELLECLKK